MNVQPGDLALVVAGRFRGATCTVLKPLGWFLERDLGRIFVWECEFPRPMVWVHGFSPNKVGDMPDGELKPLTGPDLAEGVLQQNLREWGDFLKDPAC